MRARCLFLLFLLAAGPVFGQDPLMVLASTHAGRIEFFDASLAPIAGIGVLQQLESVAASVDGRRLYIAQENNSGACCSLYSLELATQKMCALATSSHFGIPSPDGRFLFTQDRMGVHLYDAGTLTRLADMKASGMYNLQPSPDGRWLFGITNSPKPSLHIFDLNSRTLVRRLPIPSGPATGVWVGDRFFIFSYGDRGVGHLWSVEPDDHEVTREKLIGLPDIHGDCQQPVLLTMAGAHDQLYLAEALGYGVDRRLVCPNAANGGIYRIDPSAGQVAQLAPGVQVHRMVASADGRDLYVVDPGGWQGHDNPRLVQVDARTGIVLHRTALEPGDWNVTIAHIPRFLAPTHNVHATVSCAP